MSLIQKAMQRQVARNADALPHEDERRAERHPSQGLDPPLPPRPEAEERLPSFVLDFRRLARAGFITPRRLASPLAREVAAAKRRLIRRLDFFRHDRRSVHPPSAPNAGNMVLVTSGSAGEGKTFLAVNLALSLALEEKVGVVLVDADLMAPRLGSLFRLERDRAGLSDALLTSPTDSRGLSSLFHHAEGLPLIVLSAGSRPNMPAKLLSSAAMASITRELATRYADHLIILDGPPVLATNEAAILARYVDHVVFVVEAGSSTPETVSAALELLDSDDKVSLLLNRTTTRQERHAYSAPYYGPRTSG
jgi:protein-tyrosine kinase